MTTSNELDPMTYGLVASKLARSMGLAQAIAGVNAEAYSLNGIREGASEIADSIREALDLLGVPA